MFDTLFRVKFNWGIYIFSVIGIVISDPGISIWCLIALMIALHQFMLVFWSIGYIIPVRYIAGALMCLQMLVGPSFAYLGLDDVQFYKYKMQISEADYFSYAIPATICFILGLHFFSRLKGELTDQKGIEHFVATTPMVMYVFIIVGFFSSVMADIFNSGGLTFVLVLIGSLKFVGAFILILGSRQLKVWPLVLVFGSIILSSLGKAMFHDLMTWIIFSLSVFAIRYKPAVWVKGVVAVSFLAMILIVQQLKSTYRTALAGKEGSVEAFDDALEEYGNDKGFFDRQTLAKHNVRINQGFILTYVMNYVPAREPHANGQELYKILEAAFMPRVLAPNKLEAGDNSLVRQYSGLILSKYTSMSLGSMADGYINFGIAGGIVFMFCLGWFFNGVLIFFNGYRKMVPAIILFMPLIFYFPIRPDTALQTSLGHLVKAGFLVFMMLVLWKRELSLKRKSLRIVPS